MFSIAIFSCYASKHDTLHFVHFLCFLLLRFRATFQNIAIFYGPKSCGVSKKWFKCKYLPWITKFTWHYLMFCATSSFLFHLHSKLWYYFGNKSTQWIYQQSLIGYIYGARESQIVDKVWYISHKMCLIISTVDTKARVALINFNCTK